MTYDTFIFVREHTFLIYRKIWRCNMIFYYTCSHNSRNIVFWPNIHASKNVRIINTKPLLSKVFCQKCTVDDLWGIYCRQRVHISEKYGNLWHYMLYDDENVLHTPDVLNIFTVPLEGAPRGVVTSLATHKPHSW